MTRDEWFAMLDSEPVTPNQRGAIMRECDRLGIVDRSERLAVLAALAGLDALGSTADLTMGQAGQIVNALQRTRDRAELPDMARVDDERQGDEPAGEQISIAEALRRIAHMLYVALNESNGETKSADTGLSIEQLRARWAFPALPVNSSPARKEGISSDGR